jgi:hypothetical protein
MFTDIDINISTMEMNILNISLKNPSYMGEKMFIMHKIR